MNLLFTVLLNKIKTRFLNFYPVYFITVSNIHVESKE